MCGLVRACVFSSACVVVWIGACVGLCMCVSGCGVRVCEYACGCV